MLRLEILPTELFNAEDSTLTTTKETVLTLEHSLVSLSKWESKWCVPFLSKDAKTAQQTLDYVRCMTLTQNVNDEVYGWMSRANFDAIEEYIDAPMTATTINDRAHKQTREIITAEIVYYWMILYNVPFECQKWHLNRLLMLINVCSIKQEDPKKMRGRDVLNSNKALNEKRKAELKTRG